ncbi:ADC synthase [Lipomyces kononenkoae]|uniref:ADC synthase n=1 Tax=Lipomyces kononenkoae TaxID=34357 RepID=A0ACC3T3E9_LIPKO
MPSQSPTPAAPSLQAPKVTVQPSVDTLRSLIAKDPQANIIPVFSFISSDFLTPSVAYLKLKAAAPPGSYSFLFESAYNGESIGRYSFLGANPRKVIKTGNGFGADVDPLTELEKELSQYHMLKLPGLPAMSGGAIGYVSYDCIKYFEPKTARELKDNLGIPESVMMLFDNIVAFDHVFQRVQIITNIHAGQDGASALDLEASLEEAKSAIQSVADVLYSPTVELPYQPAITPNQKYTSNVGREGYENHVKKLKDHIFKGDIFQGVPSQRVLRPTSLHPFNIYRHLRTVNPSPYMFYIDNVDFQIVGASPELLVKSENGRIITHPIAGTVPRGKSREEDDKLAMELKGSLKDRAEHVMLVDLARNDITRVCDPTTTSVDRLMLVERFSHVMHLVSQVSGVLREGKTRFDAFRSIFPAGTVSGAPKVRAMELISELEGERRGIYAGAVGHWGYEDTSMDTCIALRTMLVKDGVAYLQAGGGIVYDSDPYDEYLESMNKLGSNMRTITEAEQLYMNGN